jgi:hypothetical protein
VRDRTLSRTEYTRPLPFPSFSLLSQAGRPVTGRRAEESRRPFRLSRPDVRSIAEAVDWLQNWQGEDGHTPWNKPWWDAERNDDERLRTLKRMLFVRFWSRVKWIERGGR